ncbi:MAG: hypothetical protein ACE5IZ_07110 [Dehalococcoidia bacterium]
MMDEELRNRLETLMVTLLEAVSLPGVKSWAMEITLAYALARDPTANKRDVWKTIQEIYEEHIRDSFPDQEDPGQSFRRASGDAFEGYVAAYLNSNDVLKKEGVRVLRLVGQDFHKLMSRLGIDDLKPKDVDMFLQGISQEGQVVVFGAIFPKASYAERIRADEYASRSLMARGLWSGTVTMDARGELGTEEKPSVKRDKINSGAFHGCYSFNGDTAPGPRIHTIDCMVRTMRNPLIRDIVRAWRTYQEEGAIDSPQPLAKRRG